MSPFSFWQRKWHLVLTTKTKELQNARVDDVLLSSKMATADGLSNGQGIATMLNPLLQTAQENLYWPVCSDMW